MNLERLRPIKWFTLAFWLAIPLNQRGSGIWIGATPMGYQSNPDDRHVGLSYIPLQNSSTFICGVRRKWRPLGIGFPQGVNSQWPHLENALSFRSFGTSQSYMGDFAWNLRWYW